MCGKCQTIDKNIQKKLRNPVRSHQATLCAGDIHHLQANTAIVVVFLRHMVWEKSVHTNM